MCLNIYFYDYNILYSGFVVWSAISYPSVFFSPSVWARVVLVYGSGMLLSSAISFGSLCPWFWSIAGVDCCVFVVGLVKIIYLSFSIRD